MAYRLWRAAHDVRVYDELPSGMLRIQQAAHRSRANDLAMVTIEGRMKEAFQRTGLGWMVGQVQGLGGITLIALLALSGDPRRFDDSGCLVKLAGANPTERSSGKTIGSGGIHRRGRSTLRAVAFQGAVLLSKHNPDFRARCDALTQRQQRPLRKKQALVALANKLLRTIWSMAITGQPYSSAIATGDVRPIYARVA